MSIQYTQWQIKSFITLKPVAYPIKVLGLSLLKFV